MSESPAPIPKLSILDLLDHQQTMIAEQTDLIARQNDHLAHIGVMLHEQREEIAHIKAQLYSVKEANKHGMSNTQLAMLNPRLRRNILPNDHSAIHKQLIAMWRASSAAKIGYADLLASGFRVFSQNDEDGVLLRIFSHIGYTNQYVIEIGSNCSDSDLGIPENLSTNLIVNHGWHGSIFDIDQTECDRMRYFFARDFATKHFHVTENGVSGYFSPLIITQAINPENIEKVLRDAHAETEPDLMVIDIDGGDYAVMSKLAVVRPRVLVIEFEKRFRDRHSVVQFDNTQFSKRWAQSGAASLPAWEKLMHEKGYVLCSIANCGFNAFFVRADIAEDKFIPISSRAAFDFHPILSKVPESFWLLPDETWIQV